MPKYLLLKHYNGGPAPLPNCVPMSEWTPEEITAHIAFQREVVRVLTPFPEANGEPIFEWIEVRPVMSDPPASE
jgi:hypothetical protein